MQFSLRMKQPGRALTLSLAEYVSPLQPEPKTAILIPGFRESKRVRVFPGGWDEETAHYRPAVVGAPVEDLIRLARSWDERWERPRRALVAFSFEHGESPSETDKDELWDRFGVPLFEQCLNFRRELIAAECEAHEGLHLAPQFAGLEGWRLARVRCACGNPAPKVLREVRRAMAASA